MLAYVFWHRPAAGVERERYEHELARFHRSLAHRPPSGLRGSASVRVPELPWLPVSGEREGASAVSGPSADGQAAAAGYEDWYVVDDWTAVGVLEEAAVSRGHVTAHDAIASRAGAGGGAVYRLLEGCARPAGGEVAVWVTPAPGRERLALDALLGDGIDRERDGLWRRCLVLGPAPEYCLLAAEASAGVAATRLPTGWRARTLAREPVGDD
ncbi:MAG TPA: hypothetical protein VK707_05180 [Solirubrobacteraceae bacterium]|jgi:hypothetical protein|nr:hypothetical protein [Solirubrobacteraceae bacterium]